MSTLTLLAATLTITFEGLLAFVGPDVDEKTHVAFVDDAHHGPSVEFMEPGQQTPTEITLKQNDRITFSTGSGTATTDATFDTRVPTLSDYIQAGTLDTAVKGKLAHNHVLAYLELPSGSLTATGSLRHVARFTKTDGTTEIRCPAKTVIFTATVTDPVTITIAGDPPKRPVTRTIDTSAPVRVENDTNHLGNHYNLFARLLTFGGKLGKASEITSQDCTKDGQVLDRDETKRRRAGTIVPFAPNGDCGPTDFP